MKENAVNLNNKIRSYFAIALFSLVGFYGNVAQAGKVTLSAKEQDIRALIESVSRITGRTFIIDPRVKNQKVTILSREPMEEEEVYQVFLSALRVHGVAAVETGNVTKIVQDQTAKVDSSPVTTGSGSKYDGDEMITTIIRVRNTDAQQLLSVLRTLTPTSGHFTVYRPTNVLIIHDRAANIKRLNKIIQQVDKASNEELEIINLQHAAAGEVVRILESLAKKSSGTKKGGAATAEPRFVADERTNSILLLAGEDSRLRLRSVIAHLDTPLETSGNTKVIHLKNAKAKDLVQVLTGVVESIDTGENKGGATARTRRRSSSTKKDFNIEAHEDTNSLVITATPDIMKSIEVVIRQLDIARSQVHVEAIIVEFSENLAKRLGIQWLFGGDNSPGGYISMSDPNIAAVASAAADGNESALIPLLNGVRGIAAGVGSFSENGFSFGALINAIAEDSDTNILSTPSLMTMDNEEASISIGEEVPVLTGQSLGSNNANPFSQVNRQDIGIKLKIKPQINSGDAVRLEIEQEVSALAGNTGIDITIAQRKIQTTIMVDNGQTIVLGGLIDDSVIETVDKVPLLGDIPLFGHLFRSQSSQKTKRNLMVFIRPTIIHDPKSSNLISSQKYNYMRGLQIESRQRGINLMMNRQVTVMPEYDEDMIIPPTFDEVMKKNRAQEEVRVLEESKASEIDKF